MYGTTAYLYQQIQEVLMIDISGVGTVFDRRWQPVYAKPLTLNLGVDNVLLFQFQNQDQKPVSISGSTFVFRIISQDGQNLLYATETVTLNAATGRAKVTIPAADTLRFQPQPASWSLAVSSGVLTQAVYTDDKSYARGDINIVDTVFPAFVASEELTIPSQSGLGNLWYSSTLTTNGSQLTTFQIDNDDFTGNLRVQGSPDAAQNTVEWYDIPFRDLGTGDMVDYLDFDHNSERIGINVEGFHPYIQLVFAKDSGNIGDIVYR